MEKRIELEKRGRNPNQVLMSFDLIISINCLGETGVVLVKSVMKVETVAIGWVGVEIGCLSEMVRKHVIWCGLHIEMIS